MSFVVGPVLNAEVARACNRRTFPYSPGCGTASEISAEEKLGCEIGLAKKVQEALAIVQRVRGKQP